MRKSVLLTLASSAAVLVMATSASQAQNFSLPPSFGSVTLRAGFLPDPHIRNLTAGGAIRAQDRFRDCRGYIADAPDYSLYYTAGGQDLFINVDADRDTTLVVNGPNGNWYCDDDGGDEPLNPLLYWSNPPSGRYDIWVGTYSQGTGVPATLFISELREHTRESANVQPPRSGRVDISRPAIYSTFSLNGGFLPDPYRIPLTAGGPLRASENISSDCRGYVTGAPSVQMTYNGYGTVHIYTEGSADTTLAINAPDGRWFCSDDALGTDAGLSFNSGTNGTYDIYVGTYGSSQASTTLMISEIQLGYNPGGK